MLRETGRIIYSALSSDTELIGMLTNGADSIYPVIASDKEGDQFITYLLRFEGFLSKSRSKEYNLTIDAFAEDYDQAIDISEEVIRIFEAMPDVQFEVLSSEPEYLQELNNMKVRQNYKLKIT